MKALKPFLLSGWLAATGVFWSGSGALSAQPITNPGSPRVIIMPGASLQIQGGGVIGQPITPGISVVPGLLDTNAPTFGYAEFDPPVVPPGSRVFYRLIVGCPDGVVRPPETIPTPRGLTLTPGAAGQQLVLVSGRVWRLWTFNYHATPEHQGPDIFIMPAFIMEVNGRHIAVPSANLQITSEDDPAARRPLEFVLRAPDRTVYVGETIPVHVSLSGSTGGAGGLQSMTKLEFAGDAFLVDQNSIYARQRKTLTNRGGKHAVTIETDVLVTPLREGALTLSAQAEATVDAREGMPSLLAGYRPLVESLPVVINATNVPTAGTMPGFNGAIGRFQVDPPRLSTNHVRVGDPLTLTLTLRAEGNIQTIPAPELPQNADWQVLTPSADPPQPAPDGSAVIRSFHYTLIPLAERIVATPSIPFSFFDPAEARFVDLTIPPQPLTVVPAPTNDIAAVAGRQLSRPPVVFPEDTGAREDRFRPLADSPGRPAGTLAPMQARPGFLLLQIVPAVALGGLWLWDRRRRFLAAHPEILELRGARRACRIHLAESRAAAATGDAPQFAAAVVGAMRALCAPQVEANPDSLVCGDVLELLPAERRAGRDGELIRNLFAVMDARRFSHEELESKSLLTRRPEAEALLNVMLAQLRSHVNHRIRRRTNAHATGNSAAVAVGGNGAVNGNGRVRPLALLLALACLATPSRAEQPPEIFRRGVADYTAGNYEQAAAAFRECARQQPSSGTFHNLGNAEWLGGNTGEAILAWERAAWLNAFDHNRRANLLFARNAARLDAPPFSWFEACSEWLPARFWAWTAAGGFWFAGTLLVLPQVLRWRKAYWHQAGAALGLTVFLLTLPALAGVQSRARRGVVMEESTPVRLTPTRDGEVLTRLPAGETAAFTRAKPGYFYIRTAGGGSGWVDAGRFRLIARYMSAHK